MGSTGAQVILILVLIGFEGFFAAAEIALISARRAALQQNRVRKAPPPPSS